MDRNKQNMILIFSIFTILSIYLVQSFMDYSHQRNLDLKLKDASNQQLRNEICRRLGYSLDGSLNEKSQTLQCVGLPPHEPDYRTIPWDLQ